MKKEIIQLSFNLIVFFLFFKGDNMNYKSLEHFRYNISVKPKLGRIIYSTKCKLDNKAKTYLEATPLRYDRISKKNKNNKDNRNFSY